MPYLVVNKISGGVIASMPTKAAADELARITNSKNKGTCHVVPHGERAKPARRKPKRVTPNQGKRNTKKKKAKKSTRKKPKKR